MKDVPVSRVLRMCEGPRAWDHCFNTPISKLACKARHLESPDSKAVHKGWHWKGNCELCRCSGVTRTVLLVRTRELAAAFHCKKPDQKLRLFACSETTAPERAPSGSSVFYQGSS